MSDLRREAEAWLRKRRAAGHPLDPVYFPGRTQDLAAFAEHVLDGVRVCGSCLGAKCEIRRLPKGFIDTPPCPDCDGRGVAVREADDG